MVSTNGFKPTIGTVPELICSSVLAPMEFRVLYNNAYEHTQVVLNLCNKLGFRGDATAEVKTLVMLADAALQEEDFSQADENAM